MNWYWHESSEKERALWDKVAAMMYDYFEDMLFRRDSITEPFSRVQTLAAKGDIYSDEYMDGEWEDEVVRRFCTETKNCEGTSNVYLAMKYNVTPIGTYAHEFVQMYQGIDSIPLAYTNHYAMQDWYDEYKGDNGTALTDTITTDLFLMDFDRSMVNNYTGVRHDSGDPYEWGEKIIAHYKKYGVDPKTKVLLFSDSLDFDRAQALYEYFKDRTSIDIR